MPKLSWKPHSFLKVIHCCHFQLLLVQKIVFKKLKNTSTCFKFLPYKNNGGCVSTTNALPNKLRHRNIKPALKDTVSTQNTNSFKILDTLVLLQHCFHYYIALTLPTNIIWHTIQYLFFSWFKSVFFVATQGMVLCTR